MMRAIGRADLADDPALATNAGRVQRTEELDRSSATWTARHDLERSSRCSSKAEVPSGRDLLDRGHRRRPALPGARHDRAARLADGEVLLPGIVPKLSETPGGTRWIGPELGEHTDEVLSTLGYAEDEIAAMRARGVIG